MVHYKVLRHKNFIHTYGNFLKDFRDEIFYSEIPKLFHPTTTMAVLREQLDEYPNALKKLEEYELLDAYIEVDNF